MWELRRQCIPAAGGLHRFERQAGHPGDPVGGVDEDVIDGPTMLCLPFSILLLSPHELLEKLAALVPPPRLNLIRYHGILAPSARDRARIVPSGEDEPEAPSESTHQPCPHRLSWCQLLARVFSIDVTECPDCGGRMHIVAALTDPASIRSFLDGVGLPARPPPIAPARHSQQSEFEYAA